MLMTVKTRGSENSLQAMSLPCQDRENVQGQHRVPGKGRAFPNVAEVSQGQMVHAQGQESTGCQGGQEKCPGAAEQGGV